MRGYVDYINLKDVDGVEIILLDKRTSATRLLFSDMIMTCYLCSSYIKNKRLGSILFLLLFCPTVSTVQFCPIYLRSFSKFRKKYKVNILKKPIKKL